MDHKQSDPLPNMESSENWLNIINVTWVRTPRKPQPGWECNEQWPDNKIKDAGAGAGGG